jgi:hypothetical protein
VFKSNGKIIHLLNKFTQERAFWGNTKKELPLPKNTNSGSKLQQTDYDKCVGITVVVK